MILNVYKKITPPTVCPPWIWSWAWLWKIDPYWPRDQNVVTEGCTVNRRNICAKAQLQASTWQTPRKSKLGKEANDNVKHFLHFAVKFFPVNPTNINNDYPRWRSNSNSSPYGVKLCKVKRSWAWLRQIDWDVRSISSKQKHLCWSGQ